MWYKNVREAERELSFIHSYQGCGWFMAAGEDIDKQIKGGWFMAVSKENRVPLPGFSHT